MLFGGLIGRKGLAILGHISWSGRNKSQIVTCALTKIEGKGAGWCTSSGFAYYWYKASPSLFGEEQQIALRTLTEEREWGEGLCPPTCTSERKQAGASGHALTLRIDPFSELRNGERGGCESRKGLEMKWTAAGWGQAFQKKGNSSAKIREEKRKGTARH